MAKLTDWYARHLAAQSDKARKLALTQANQANAVRTTNESLARIRGTLERGEPPIHQRLRDMFPQLRTSRAGDDIGNIQLTVDRNTRSSSENLYFHAEPNEGGLQWPDTDPTYPRKIDLGLDAITAYQQGDPRKPWQAALSPEDRISTVLLHELTHDLRHRRGRPFDMDAVESAANLKPSIFANAMYPHILQERSATRAQMSADLLKRFREGRTPVMAGAAAAGAGAMALSPGESDAGVLENAKVGRALKIRTQRGTVPALSSPAISVRGEIFKGGIHRNALDDAADIYGADDIDAMWDGGEIDFGFVDAKGKFRTIKELQPILDKQSKGIMAESDNLRDQGILPGESYQAMNRSKGDMLSAAPGMAAHMGDKFAEGVGIPKPETAASLVQLIGLAAAGNPGARHAVSTMARQMITDGAAGFRDFMANPIAGLNAAEDAVKADPLGSLGYGAGMIAGGMSPFGRKVPRYTKRKPFNRDISDEMHDLHEGPSAELPPIHTREELGGEMLKDVPLPGATPKQAMKRKIAEFLDRKIPDAPTGTRQGDYVKTTRGWAYHPTNPDETW